MERALSRALSRVLHHPVPLILAGRTDAGAHALCMPATFRLPSSPPPPPTRRLLFLINQALSHDGDHRHLHVISLSRISPSFHPRFSATSRLYLYRIITGPSLLFHLNRAWHLPAPLHLPSIQHAATLLTGKHDFSSLISHHPKDSRTPIRTLNTLQVKAEKVEGREGTEMVEVRMEGPSFLRRQVRNIVAVLVEVGRGRMQPEEVQRLLQGAPRSRNPLTPAPADGLFLEKVGYNEELMRQWLIPEREEEAEVGESSAVLGEKPAFKWRASDALADASEQLWKREPIAPLPPPSEPEGTPSSQPYNRQDW